jgi:two-component sensor histidine kinase
VLTRAGSSSVDEYVEGFQRRIVALSEAYNLLTDNNWQGANLRKIVSAMVEPYGRPDQISVDGPSVGLPPRQTLALAAALQELATNAAKYGALSAERGRLDVRWSFADQKLNLTWIESDGPAVTRPTRRGFGSRLIEEVMAHEGGWTSELRYRPEGLQCYLSLQLTALANHGTAAADMS